MFKNIKKPGYHKIEVVEHLILEKDDYKNEPEKWNTVKELFGFGSVDEVTTIKVSISSIECFVENKRPTSCRGE